MTCPPWGQKPPPVDDVWLYWGKRPPEMSERCKYWVRRFQEGSWRPNKRVQQSDECDIAEMLGIYIWEATDVIWPICREDRLHRVSSAA